MYPALACKSALLSLSFPASLYPPCLSSLSTFQFIFLSALSFPCFHFTLVPDLQGCLFFHFSFFSNTRCFSLFFCYFPLYIILSPLFSPFSHFGLFCLVRFFLTLSSSFHSYSVISSVPVCTFFLSSPVFLPLFLFIFLPFPSPPFLSPGHLCLVFLYLCFSSSLSNISFPLPSSLFCSLSPSLFLCLRVFFHFYSSPSPSLLLSPFPFSGITPSRSISLFLYSRLPCLSLPLFPCTLCLSLPLLAMSDRCVNP